MIILGLTGSIGMGKSTASRYFLNQNIPVSSADEIVHELYKGRAVPFIDAAFPGTIVKGEVDRKKLLVQLMENPENFIKLEKIVHPLVKEEETKFLKTHKDAGAKMVVLDIPLLFENPKNKERIDKVLVVTCSLEEQKKRVLNRDNMTVEKFNLIVSKQMPDEEKRKHADFIVDTSGSFENTNKQLQFIIDQIIK